MLCMYVSLVTFIIVPEFPQTIQFNNSGIFFFPFIYYYYYSKTNNNSSQHPFSTPSYYHTLRGPLCQQIASFFTLILQMLVIALLFLSCKGRN